MPKLHIKKEDSEITLLDEGDIQGKLNEKLNTSDAFSGSYTDLSNKPSIPSKTSDLTNDSGFLTQHQDISGKANRSELSTVATSGSYNDLTNKPSIPNIESVYEITSDKGTASEDTMGKLYIEIKNNKRDVYYTSSDTTELGYFYFKKDSDKLYVYGNFYDPEKYYYLLKDEYQIVDSFEYDNDESLWVISQGINYINGYFAIGISDTEVERYDATATYMNPSNNYYITDYYYSSEYVSELENNVNSQYIDIVKDNDYNWHKLDDDVLDNLSIRWIDIQNRPSIPSKTSDLTNDSNFLTSHQDVSGKEDKSNKTTSLSSSSTDTQYPSAKVVYDTIQAIPSPEFIEITSNKGTASASTMDKFYVEVANNKRDVYYTEENNGSYSWHKLDTDVLDDLSIDWSDVQNKPNIPSASSSTPSADVSGGAIGSSSNYAKADHQHPLSSAYATSGHNHSGTYAPVSHTQASTTITDMDVVQVVVTYTDDTTETLNLFKKVVSQ